jgi:transcriptional/translational regulatory protein YebC/TACO1
MTVRQKLEEDGITIDSSEVSMIPQNTLDLEEKPALQNLKLLQKLEELDEVQLVSSNVNFTDEILEKFEE